MIRVLFVCHGNICRSPMAEMIFSHMCNQRHIDCMVDSAATSRQEIGNGVYPHARQKLKEMGIPCSNHRARQVQKDEYDRWDLIIIMDSWNKRNIMRILGEDPQNKVHLLLEYTGEMRDVADPWFSDDFDTAYRDISRGCKALLDHLTEA